MSHVWLIESLVELRVYAARNGLCELSKHLDLAIHLAHVELALRESEETHLVIQGKDQQG